jgi:hypothetical protein
LCAGGLLPSDLVEGAKEKLLDLKTRRSISVPSSPMVTSLASFSLWSFLFGRCGAVEYFIIDYGRRIMNQIMLR